MSLIPQSFIDELLNRTDLVRLIDSRLPLKKAGKDYLARCPFHEEKTPSFHVSPDKQIYYCFGCHAHGDAIAFLMNYEHLPFREALSDLAQAAGLTLPEAEQKAENVQQQRALLAQMERASALYQQALKDAPQAQQYLQGRGIDGACAKRFGIGYAPAQWDYLLRQLGREAGGREALSANGLLVAKDKGKGHYDRFRDRIMFPIHDHRGRIVAFGGRVLDPQNQPKYLNSPETQLYQKSELLYGFHQAREAIRAEQRVLVVEGYMDVIALHQHGFKTAVATCGTATSKAHLERLFRAAPEVVFSFDGDRAGREAAWRALEGALESLQEGRVLRFLFLPEGEDPDSLVRREGRAGFAQRLTQTVPALDFLFARLGESLDLDKLDDKARLASLAKPYLQKVPKGPLRALYEQKMRELVGMTPLQPATSTRPLRVTPQDKLSVLERSLALLLQYPTHPDWASLDRPLLAQVDKRGIHLLCQILEIVVDTPDVNTATLLSRLAEQPEAAKLAKLASRDFAEAFGWQGDEHGQDIAGCVQALNSQARQAHLDRLKQRMSDTANPLSEAEKVELLQLLPRARPSRSQ